MTGQGTQKANHILPSTPLHLATPKPACSSSMSRPRLPRFTEPYPPAPLAGRSICSPESILPPAVCLSAADSFLIPSRQRCTRSSRANRTTENENPCAFFSFPADVQGTATQCDVIPLGRQTQEGIEQLDCRQAARLMTTGSINDKPRTKQLGSSTVAITSHSGMIHQKKRKPVS